MILKGIIKQKLMKLTLLFSKFKSQFILSVLFLLFFSVSCNKDGDCEEKTCNDNYIEIYAPVCGCNNVTYSNSSEAECKGITSYTDGKCKKEEEEEEVSDCKEKKCEDVYIQLYDPVCGCNKITYSNAAEAACKGITSYKKGECGKLSCGDSTIIGSEINDNTLHENIKKWQSFQICNYSFTRVISCYCTEDYTSPKSFKIKNGLLTHINNKKPQDNQIDNRQTIYEMFKLINDLYAQTTHEIKVTYHEKYGFPTYLYVDYDKGIADDESSYKFSNFIPVK